jgi:hypothetical protein
VHELVEKMGGIMVVQLDKGVTTTNMNIIRRGSSAGGKGGGGSCGCKGKSGN